MSDVVLKIENIAKMYDLGEVGTGTLSKDLNRTWAKIMGKPDPYATLAELNDRTKKSTSGLVWALKDINFNVKQGEVLGIIGKNGAGKSTLLKVLSQITSPSTGSIKIKGRVASLLEVGTGMHPEMTARENIYLNGAIMGMSRLEITRKLDEIVDFAGISKYIDTPIKRFSSGMTVRLGFAVAAFLEPEILIVDEVLAVGDIEFQKKAIGKMKSVSGEDGRTVLFVSHNMQSIQQLCNRAVLLDQGEVVFEGTSTDTIEKYYSLNSAKEDLSKEWTIDNAKGNEKVKILKVSVSNAKNKDKAISIETGFQLEVEFYNHLIGINLDCTLEIRDLNGTIIYHKGILVITDKGSKRGIYSIKLIVPPYLLNQNNYSINLIFGDNQRYLLFRSDEIITFEIAAMGASSSTKRPGLIYSDFEKTIKFKSFE